MVKLGQLFSRIVAFCLNLLPWKMNYYFSAVLAFIWLDLFRIRKNLIDENITRAFPNISFTEKKIIAKKSMIGLCRSFFDVMRIPYLTDEWIKHNVIFEGAKTIENVKSEKSGFFFLSLHVGSGDLGAAIVSRCIRPSTLISKRFTNKFLDSFWFDLRQQSETEFINAHGKNNAFDILTALKKGRGTIFVLDQFMGKPYGVETKFFGITTGTAYGLALFAKKTKKPVYPLYTYWDDQNRLHICFKPAIDLSIELSETNEVVTNKFNLELESIITQHPEHWMWVHKRWKTFE